MPTLVADPRGWLRAAGIRGLLLSGGNDLEETGEEDVSPERDALEHALLDLAQEKNLPVFGLCRGLQIIASHYGARVVPVKDHVGLPHVIQGTSYPKTVVNSFHNYGVYAFDMPERLCSLAQSEDGVVEALRVSGLAQMAVMWHPERERVFALDDIALVKKFFNVQG
jgi:putative glutamine amidotransferase